MIVYAYYGCGKTTLCKKDPDHFIDMDEELLHGKSEKEVSETINKLSRQSVVFINGRLLLQDLPIDLAFMPENKEIAIKRLKSRNVSQTFLDFVSETFEDTKNAVKERCANVVMIKESEYLSDYMYKRK